MRVVFLTSVPTCLDRTGRVLPDGLPDDSCGWHGAFESRNRHISAAAAIDGFFVLFSVFHSWYFQQSKQCSDSLLWKY